MFDKSKWKDEIATLVNTRQHVSFAEIEASWPAEAKGESVLHIPGRDNLIVWHGLAMCLAEAVTEMVADGVLHLHPTTILVYLADHHLLDMPVATSIEVPTDAPLHWLPVTLCTFKGDREQELDSIRDRLREVGDWTNGRSAHTFQTAEAHSAALARTYVKDVRFLLGMLRHLQDTLEEANGVKPRSEVGPGDPS